MLYNCQCGGMISDDVATCKYCGRPTGGAAQDGVLTGAAREEQAVFPRTELQGWSWGAFGFTWLWLACHRVRFYWVLLAMVLWIIPLVNLAMAVHLGNRGFELAWRATPLAPAWQIRHAQHTWAIFYLVFILVSLSLGLIGALAENPR